MSLTELEISIFFIIYFSLVLLRSLLRIWDVNEVDNRENELIVE